MPDAQYPPEEALTPGQGDDLFMTQAESDTRYVQRAGLQKFAVQTAEPSSPATNDLWLEIDA